MMISPEFLALFQEAFKGRTDVVAEYWLSKDGKRPGYRPICKNRWKKGVCRKSCKACPNQDYIPFSDELLLDHIKGKHVLGLYPLLTDNTCHFVAADFDNHKGDCSPLNDIKAFYAVCEGEDLPFYALRSKSGSGFHGYIFFRGAVTAWKARTVAFALLEKAKIGDEKTSLPSSFDRLFPNQDELSGKGLGNLIALPFQGEARKSENTLFLDPETDFERSFSDQQKVLAEIRRVDEATLDKLINRWDLKRASCAGGSDTRACSFEGIPTEIPEGERNYTLFRYACRLRSQGRERDEVELLVLKAASECKPPLADSEALTCVESAWKYPGSSEEVLYAAYKDEIEELNEKHAVAMIEGKCIVLNEVVEPAFGREDVTFSTRNDFFNCYAHKKVEVRKRGGTEEISIAKVWWESLRRRQYEGIVFSPDSEVPGHYNLYRGLDKEPKPGDWSLFRNHIFEIICDGNKDHFSYLIAWLARIVQDPGGERPGTSIVLRGEQGTGKGIFVNEFGSILGKHYLHITNQCQLTGKFNNHLKDALLVFVDEGFWAGSKSEEGVLKALITEPRLMIEPKCVNAFMVRNHVNVIMASNNDWVVPAGLDERRHFVLDVNNKHKQDHSYFGPIVEQMESGGHEAMLFDLLRMDISKVNLRAIPKTPALLDQKLASMSSVQKFWYEKLTEGSVTETLSWDDGMPPKTVFDGFLDFCRDQGVKPHMTQGPFSKQLHDLCPGIHKKKTMISFGPFGPEKRGNVWVFPPLEKCRESFAKKLEMDVPWDDAA
jgi:hypothetical protein